MGKKQTEFYNYMINIIGEDNIKSYQKDILKYMIQNKDIAYGILGRNSPRRSLMMDMLIMNSYLKEVAIKYKNEKQAFSNLKKTFEIKTKEYSNLLSLCQGEQEDYESIIQICRNISVNYNISMDNAVDYVSGIMRGNSNEPIFESLYPNDKFSISAQSHMKRFLNNNKDLL